MRVVGVGVAVERAVRGRVAVHDHEVAAVLGQRPLAERALVGRGQVGLVGGRAGDLERLAEVQGRQLARGPRGTSRPSSSTACAGPLVDRGDHPGDDVAQAGDHLVVVLDEAELDVEADVLGQVPHRVVRLGPEHRPDLVDPLEDADQHLLVELRALGEVRRPAEVVDLEDVRAGLGGRLDQLGGVHLGEAGRVERGPEPVQAGRRQLPHGAPARVPPGRRGVVEQGRQPGVEGRPPELDRRGVGRVAEGA